MKKTFSILAGFFLVATFGLQAQESSVTTAEKWRCFDFWDSNKETVLVKLTRAKKNGEDLGYGEVSVAGVNHRARFQVSGINRRWDFGDGGDYAFIIKPDGSGGYYDFSNVKYGDETGPRQFFNCVSP